MVLENDVGRVEATARLDVIAHRTHSASGLRARSLSPKPAFNGSNFLSASARYGSRARLFCDIKAVPTPFLKWYRDGIPLEQCRKYTSSYNGHVASLEIDQVTFEDQGIYTCVAENRNGKGYTSMQLHVLKNYQNGPPRILKPLPATATTQEGSSIALNLQIEGSKPFDFVWMKDGCVLPDCEEFRQEFSETDGVARLIIRDPFGEDSGRYTCEVYNVFGEASSRCHLTVIGK